MMAGPLVATCLGTPSNCTIARVPVFFFLEYGRCRAKARSLHEHKQERHLYKGISSPMRRQIDYNKTQTKNRGQPNTTTRKSPSQTCVSPEETAKQTAKQQTNTKNGARAQTKHPQNRFAMGRSGLSTASLSKTCQ